MKHHILYIFTRTPLHVGTGSSVGAIDMPVQRERHTRHPIIPGSSIKGVTRYTAESVEGLEPAKIRDMFGPDLAGDDGAGEAQAGDITFGEAHPLAFPVRSAKGSFAYITCPLALSRFARDTKHDDLPAIQSLDEIKQGCIAGAKVTLPSKKVVLEEYAFTSQGDFPQAWEDALKNLVGDAVWKEASGRLVLLSDGDFSHFVSTTTEISQHIKIDPRTGAVARGALFNLESVPAETLFFAPVQVIERGRNKRHKDRDKQGPDIYTTDCSRELAALFESHPVMQFGGNSTTGRGFCTVRLA